MNGTSASRALSTAPIPIKRFDSSPLGPDSGRFAGLQQKLAEAVVTSPPWDFEGENPAITCWQELI